MGQPSARLLQASDQPASLLSSCEHLVHANLQAVPVVKLPHRAFLTALVLQAVAWHVHAKRVRALSGFELRHIWHMTSASSVGAFLLQKIRTQVPNKFGDGKDLFRHWRIKPKATR